LQNGYNSNNGQQETTVITRFEQYDDKVNVDDFNLLHNDFFDDLLLLPGIRLQKNNPGRETLTAFESYTVNYTYTYNDKKAPLTRSGDLLYTTGPNAGKRFQDNTSYSYY